jgi:hypothetical protein
VSDVLATRDERTEPPPRGLFERLRADPAHAPELIALAASERHAPTADAWARRERRIHGTAARELAQQAKRRHASFARLEGAATGVGGAFTLVPDLVGLAWIQSRMVFFIAAAHGLDPHDPLRPAELLVLTGLYATPAQARAALDGTGTSIAEAYAGSRAARDEALVARLLRMVGKRTGKRLAGRLIPGFAVAFNALANERDTRALADRAIEYYGG